MAARWLYATARAGRELRRDRRSRYPVFEVAIADGLFKSVNWSLGGVLLQAAGEPPDFDARQTVTGTIRAPAHPEAGAVAFQGKVVHVEARSRRFAVEFERDPEIFGFFDLCLKERLR